MGGAGRLIWRRFFIKLLHWEYWSFSAIYTCVFPVYGLLALRHRSFFFFAASNPTIENGGLLNESKKDIHRLLPPHLYPASLHFSSGIPAEQALNEIRKKGFEFPVVGKPDVGGRGRGVKLLRNEDEVSDYIHRANVDFHIQQYVDYDQECGIFFCRLPNEQQGRITGIVGKYFLSVTGNGKATLRELIIADQRALIYLDSLENMYGNELGEVPKQGERKTLVSIGNHARGALFLDETHRVDEQLTHTINEICRQIDGFYFGRIDIRFKSWDTLKEGRDFFIIEVNGAGSEPTHIYDPGHTLFFAWKEIIRHWWWMSRISHINHQRGYPYLTFRQGMAMFRKNKLHSKALASMPE